MTPDSVRNVKAKVSEGVCRRAGLAPETVSFFASTEPPMPDGVALGIAKRPDGEHVVAVRAESEEAAAPIVALAPNEADVKIIRVTKRLTADDLRRKVRPLIPGAQLNIKGATFVGTLGFFATDERGVRYAVSNSHVVADMGHTPLGTIVGQPFGSEPIGVLDRFVPFSPTAPALVDCAAVRLDGTSIDIPFTHAIPGSLVGARRVEDADLGIAVSKIGRTTGVKRGKITATEVDGLGVDMGDFIVRFHDQIEVSGGPAVDFSAPGDSGSLIVGEDRHALALLFAGGRDDTGEDRTYANQIDEVLRALNLELAL